MRSHDSGTEQAVADATIGEDIAPADEGPAEPSAASDAPARRTVRRPTADAPRLIATDLDGTFLSPDGTVTATNAEAVRAAVDAGIRFVVATGRPIRWLDEVSDLDGHAPLVIASNGAMLYDTGRDEVLRTAAIDPDVALQVICDLRAALPGITFAVEQGRRYGMEPDYQRSYIALDADAGWIFTAPAEELVAAGPFVKLLVQHLDYGPDDLLAAAEPIVAGRLTVTHSADDGVGRLEISGAGVSKAWMLTEHGRELGIEPIEMAAFGDMPNDAEMLGCVGRPYAMAQAHPSLAASGATVIGSNADSAVGRTILGWLTD